MPELLINDEIATDEEPPNWRLSHIKKVSTLLLSSGSCSVVLGVVGIILFTGQSYQDIYPWVCIQPVLGILGGLFVIATGTTGYQTARKNVGADTGTTYVDFLVMCLISFALCGFSSIFTFWYLVVHVMLFFNILASLITSIFGSVFCVCRDICCGSGLFIGGAKYTV